MTNILSGGAMQSNRSHISGKSSVTQKTQITQNAKSTASGLTGLLKTKSKSSSKVID